MALFEPVDNLTKLYVPLWWYGQVAKLDDHSQAHCDLTPGGGAKFGEHGYIFGAGDYLIDDAGRKVLTDGTTGEWSSIYLTDGDVPVKGSVQGTGTRLYLNTLGTAPKITGKIVLHSRYCPNLTYLCCHTNSITVLDVSTMASLTTLHCHSNPPLSVLDVAGLSSLTSLHCGACSISVLDVAGLTSLAYLACHANSITVLDVSSLTSLSIFLCHTNSISTLDVSALTLLTMLYCNNNTISLLDVSALTSLTTLCCHNNSMNQAMVDIVLCDMDGHGTNNGTLSIQNNAAPSAAGIACKNNLIGRGWTVTTD